MGVTAENIAKKYNITREEQDEFAYNSQKRAKAAIESGKFKEEIVPIEIKMKKESVTFLQDEYPRFDTSLEKLSKLKPSFVDNGTVTAGNASGINDGASAVLLASEQAVEKYGLKPIAEIVGYSQAGVDPAYMGLGPVPAIKELLSKIKMSIENVGLIELNEAFAAQSLGVLRDLESIYGKTKDWFIQRTNVNGGAIALGHPIGASGNRIVVTLLHEMKKRNIEFGLASLCIGGGMGTAMVIRNI